MSRKSEQLLKDELEELKVQWALLDRRVQWLEMRASGDEGKEAGPVISVEDTRGRMFPKRAV